jgi:hypothetical protein
VSLDEVMKNKEYTLGKIFEKLNSYNTTYKSIFHHKKKYPDPLSRYDLEKSDAQELIRLKTQTETELLSGKK